MKGLKKKLENIKAWYMLVVFFIGIIVTLFIGMHNLLNKNDEILETIQTTKQMALKSVIWNDEIPITERTSACDVYLNAGYNSMTKKECEIIINKGTEQGVFLYVEK